MPRLKKKAFLATASGALALNFAAFCFGAMSAFYRGDDSVDNQAALILIPGLLIPAAAVVSALLLVFILIAGTGISAENPVSVLSVFDFKGEHAAPKILRAGYLFCCLLAGAVGVMLFWPDAAFAILYAATGMGLLILLFALIAAAVKGNYAEKNKSH